MVLTAVSSANLLLTRGLACARSLLGLLGQCIKIQVWFLSNFWFDRPSQVVLVVKNPPANARDATDMDLIPGFGRSPGEGNGNPFQYSCQENSVDRGTWWATVHGAAKSQT